MSFYSLSRLVFSILLLGVSTFAHNHTALTESNGNYALVKLQNTLDGSGFMWPLPVGGCVPRDLNQFSPTTMVAGAYLFTCTNGTTPLVQSFTTSTCTGAATNITSELISGNWRCDATDTSATVNIGASVLSADFPIATGVCISADQIYSLNFSNANLSAVIPTTGSISFNFECNDTTSVPSYDEFFTVTIYNDTQNCTGPIRNLTGISGGLAIIASLSLQRSIKKVVYPASSATLNLPVEGQITTSTHCGMTFPPTTAQPTASPVTPSPTITSLSKSVKFGPCWRVVAVVFAALFFELL